MRSRLSGARRSPIVDVISAEDVGKLADSNVAESLARSARRDRRPPVRREGEQLSIAGVEPALNRLTIDGHSVASADWRQSLRDRSEPFRLLIHYLAALAHASSPASGSIHSEARLPSGGRAIGAAGYQARKPVDLEPNTVAVTGGGEYNSRAGSAALPRLGAVQLAQCRQHDRLPRRSQLHKEQLSRAGSAVWLGIVPGMQHCQNAMRGRLRQHHLWCDGRVPGGPIERPVAKRVAMIAGFRQGARGVVLARALPAGARAHGLPARCPGPPGR